MPQGMQTGTLDSPTDSQQQQTIAARTGIASDAAILTIHLTLAHPSNHSYDNGE